VVSLEDLVEELVGDIEDEYDRPEEESASAQTVQITAPGVDPAKLMPGVLRADELYEQCGFRLPDGPYETLAGFVMAQLGHIPVAGESVEHDGWEFTVTSVEKHRIEQVRVRPPAGWEPPSEYVPQEST
jgi:CBS domain containing-hemolysin-like protein